MASFAATLAGGEASTFNAAGLNWITMFKGMYVQGLIDAEGKIKHGRARQQDYINAYYVQGEFLSAAQDSVPAILPDAAGRRIELERGSSSWSFGQHSIKNVCKALGSQCDY